MQAHDPKIADYDDYQAYIRAQRTARYMDIFDRLIRDIKGEVDKVELTEEDVYGC